MKKSTRNTVNLVISSFLVIGYIVCSYFFSTMADQLSSLWSSVVRTLILVVFGLLLFYATRVGEGKQVHRFSLAVLLLVVVPSLYVIVTGTVDVMPLHELVAPPTADGLASTQSIVMILAGIALGYAIPYTFLSGYEMKEYGEKDLEAEIEEIEEELLEGGLAEELAETEAEIAAQTEDAAEEAAAEVEADAEKEAVEE